MSDINRLFEQFVNKVKNGNYKIYGYYWTPKHGATYSENLKNRTEKRELAKLVV